MHTPSPRAAEYQHWSIPCILSASTQPHPQPEDFRLMQFPSQDSDRQRCWPQAQSKLLRKLLQTLSPCPPKSLDLTSLHFPLPLAELPATWRATATGQGRLRHYCSNSRQREEWLLHQIQLLDRLWLTPDQPHPLVSPLVIRLSRGQGPPQMQVHVCQCFVTHTEEVGILFYGSLLNALMTSSASQQ